MNSTLASKSLLVLLLFGVGMPPLASAQGQEQGDARCKLLLEKAVGALGAERYPEMLSIAESRRLLCPDPVSAYVVGIAKANMVDQLLVSDPAVLERLRASALRHLRVATAGTGGLPSRWQYNAHEWIVHLDAFGGTVSESPLERGVHDEVGYDTEDLPIHHAPPPQPQPIFPWGPVITGALGVVAATGGLTLTLTGNAKAADAKAAERRVFALADEGGADPEKLQQWGRQAIALGADAESDQRWGHALLLSGTAAIIGAGVWYWLLPPKGKWRWALAPAPTGATVVGRF